MKKLILLLLVVFTFNSCDSYKAATNLEEKAWDTFMSIWDRWAKSEGDIIYATVWEKKVNEGVSFEEVVDAIKEVGIEANMKAVGDLPLGKELKARGIKSGHLRVLSYCSPDIARKMVDFSAAASAYLPCRVTIVDHGPSLEGKEGVERKTGLWIYTLNMDMMIELGKKMPPELKKVTLFVRNTIFEMLEAGASGGE